MDLIKEKQELRKKYLLIRKNIKNKQEKSNMIINKLIQEQSFINAKVIALYKSLNNEVDTNELIKYSLELKKIVVLPKVIENELVFYKIEKNELLEKSSFGVFEPISNNDNRFSKEKIDLVIVPGICFDLERNRLGFGKGYYDRFLCNTFIKSIALSFDEQIVSTEIIPVNEFDVKVNSVITDKKII